MTLRCLLLPMAALVLRSATYYVDSKSGDDANVGTSQTRPWKTLTKVNTTELHPGDRVRFRSGSTWRGQLVPRGSGTEGVPIVIDCYGNGTMPHIDGAGEVEDAVRLYNVQFIAVRNLEITNRGQEPATRRGVHIFLD